MGQQKWQTVGVGQQFDTMFFAFCAAVAVLAGELIRMLSHVCWQHRRQHSISR